MDLLIPLLYTDVLGKPAWVWLLFATVVVALLAFDLGVLHKDDHEIGVRESLALSGGYIAVAVLFGAWLTWQMGAQAGTEYFTGFMIEKSLSLDNVFVIATIFTFFAIPRRYQHRVLFWGILGVIVLRAGMIALGATLVQQAAWVLYLFGAFLVATGVKMWLMADHTPDLERNTLLKFLRRHLRITPTLEGHAFFVRRPHPVMGTAVTWATPLFLALALVLVFVGGKIFLVQWLGKLPALVSLGVTFSLILGGVLVSLWKTRSQADLAGASAPEKGVLSAPR